MKAFLLAAGKGNRLKPLTDTIPKCCVPIKGIPMLGIWFKLCKTHGISDVLINLHHLHHKVEDYINNNSFGINITPFYEETLLGSAGTVFANREFVKGEKCFFIIYGDNLTNVNLSKMAEFHVKKGGGFTMGLFRTNTPWACGIAEVDSSDIITSFTEKSVNPSSNLANAGIYVAGEELFNHIPEEEFMDFGFDVLPKLIGKMHGYVINEYFIDIGTIDNYKKANQEWE